MPPHAAEAPVSRKTPQDATILLPGHYRRSPLVRDLEELCDPRRAADPALFLNLVVKYFFAYLYEGAQEAVVSLPDITRLFEQFHRHRSLNEDGDDVEVMNGLRQCASALRLLADLPRAAALLRSVALHRLPPEVLERPYLGLDIGTGAGLLLLGALAQARRNGFEEPAIWGLECDRLVARRSAALARDLGLGSVVLAEGREPDPCTLAPGGPFTFISSGQPERRGRFAALLAALKASCGERLKDTVFFPEGFIVYSREMNVSMLLSQGNGFQGGGCDLEDCCPQGLISGDTVVALHRLGEEFLASLTPLGRSLLPRPS
jgi:hypothetical protein